MICQGSTITISPMATAAATITTSTTVTTSSVQLVGANANRKGFILWNNSGNSCYVVLGPTANSSTCCYIVPTFTSLTWIYPVAYTGAISAIRNSGSGTITIYELT